MKTCNILIGMPCSGKSTWLEQNASFSIANSYILSTDNIIDSISFQYRMTYNESFKDLIKFATTVFNNEIDYCIYNALDQVTIDRTNLTPKGRSVFINKFKSSGYKVNAYVFETPDHEEWNKRLDSRPGKNIPDYILENMRSYYVAPSLEEGFDEIFNVS